MILNCSVTVLASDPKWKTANDPRCSFVSVFTPDCSPSFFFSPLWLFCEKLDSCSPL